MFKEAKLKSFKNKILLIIRCQIACDKEERKITSERMASKYKYHSDTISMKLAKD